MFYPCLVDVVYDVTLGFKKGEPSILGVMNADPCEIDLFVRLVTLYNRKNVPSKAPLVHLYKATVSRCSLKNLILSCCALFHV